jgi:hypothetical protein
MPDCLNLEFGVLGETNVCERRSVSNGRLNNVRKLSCPFLVVLTELNAVTKSSPTIILTLSPRR